jgi:hypothetical protein
MEKEYFYNQWKELRRHVPVPEDFSSDVMAAIQTQSSERNEGLSDGLSHFPSRFMQWSVAAGLVMVGILRILYIAGYLLRANPLMP